MANIISGAKGAIAGAAGGSSLGTAGSIVGGGLGALAGLFGGGDDGLSDEDRARIIQIWQQYGDSLPGGPHANPEETAALSRMEEMSKTGMSKELMLGLLNERLKADQMAAGREGAIRDRAAMMGHGVSSAGNSTVLQAQASQEGAQRAQQGGMQTEAIAESGKRASLGQYLQQLARNNALKMGAAQGLAGAYANSQDYHGAEAAAKNAQLGDVLNTGAAVGMYAANKTSPAQPAPTSAGNPAETAWYARPDPVSGVDDEKKREYAFYGGA